jgi:hypothetical protein
MCPCPPNLPQALPLVRHRVATRVLRLSGTGAACGECAALFGALGGKAAGQVTTAPLASRRAFVSSVVRRGMDALPRTRAVHVGIEPDGAAGVWCGTVRAPLVLAVLWCCCFVGHTHTVPHAPRVDEDRVSPRLRVFPRLSPDADASTECVDLRANTAPRVQRQWPHPHRQCRVAV